MSKLGDESFAFRALASQTGAPVVADYVIVSVGPSRITLGALGLAPMDDGQLEAIARRAVERLVDAAGE